MSISSFYIHFIIYPGYLENAKFCAVCQTNFKNLEIPRGNLGRRDPLILCLAFLECVLLEFFAKLNGLVGLGQSHLFNLTTFNIRP